MAHPALADIADKPVLDRRVEGHEGFAMLGLRLGIDGIQADAPGLVLPGHARSAEPVLLADMQFLIDQGRHRNGRSCPRLRQDTGRQRLQHRELRRAQASGLARHRQALVDGASGRLVPGRCLTLGQHVIAGVAIVLT